PEAPSFSSLPADQQPRNRGSLSAAQSVPYGISELGNDDSSPDEKKDVYSRLFSRNERDGPQLMMTWFTLYRARRLPLCALPYSGCIVAFAGADAPPGANV
ncbi:hypothetical protein V5799_033822, partial [Amblyomma americanum]